MGSVKGTTKSGGRKNALDKFYTKPATAKYCIDKAKISLFATVIEPSAGSGAFSNQIPNCIARDLEPEAPGILKQDWFTYSPPTALMTKGKILVIGNPPFGQQNTLAIAFINHAAKFADRVAFILPISFKKESIQNRIDKHMHLTYEEELPSDSFTLKDLEYNVRCVFQIWDKKTTVRTVINKGNMKSNNLFTFVKKNETPDATIQRVGGNAGRASLDWVNKSEASNYFIKFNKSLTLKQITSNINKLNKMTYPSRDHAVGPRSISKIELNLEINKVFK
jgi:hypothetical protein